MGLSLECLGFGWVLDLVGRVRVVCGFWVGLVGLGISVLSLVF